MALLRILLDGFGIVLLVAALPLVAELLVLSVAAAFPPARTKTVSAPRLSLAVIVPAHDEEKLIASCVASLLANQYPVAVYVIAHNCTDATAKLASAAGATSLVLNESSGHGKGAALDFGFKQALTNGADAVLVIDADSTVSPNLLERVAHAIASGSSAVQCRYVVSNAGASNRTRLMALAFLGFNVLRPRGRSRLGLSCGIFGNGFALAASTLRAVPYVAHSIVEDLEYHLLLLQHGLSVDYLDDATVFGEMPAASAAAATQRARWEGGRMLMRRRFAYPLLRKVLAGHLRFAEPLVDLLSVPIATGAMLSLLALLAPAHVIRAMAVSALMTLVLYTIIAAALGDKPWENLKALVTAPAYIVFKVAMIPRTRRAARADAEWVRTERNDNGAN